MEDRIISLTKEEGAALDQWNRERLEALKNRYFVTVPVFDKRRKRHYGINETGGNFSNRNDAINWATKVKNRAGKRIQIKHKGDIEYYDIVA